MSEFSAQTHLSQQQALAPQMRKSLEILQAGAMELGQLVRAELEANPALEEVTESLSLDAGGPDPEEADSLDYLNGTDDDFLEEEILRGRHGVWTEDDEARRRHFLESFAPAETLQEHLRRQLDQALAAPAVRVAALAALGGLDERGFLENSPRELAAAAGVEPDTMAEALRLLRSLEPPGVGAADLRECLLLQLERAGKRGGTAYRVVDRHLGELARRQFGKIAAALGCGEEQVAAAAEEISRLSPDPGAAFAAGGNPFVAPDVVVEREDGNWVARLTGEGLPTLRINDHYKDMLGSGGLDPAARRYLRERISEGRGLISAIALRQETLLAVAAKIVAHQRDFLERGPGHLRPLTMTEVADELGVHNTTVSRAVAGKHMLTPHGLLEMRAFFGVGYQTSGGAELSASAIRDTLRRIIQREDPGRPHSDAELVRLLAGQGVSVARRTVAKYREQLGILPAALRRAG